MFLGCTGNQQQNTQSAAASNGEAKQNPVNPVSTQTNGTTDASQGTDAASANAPQDAVQNTDAGQTISDSFSGLANRNVPLLCDVSYAYQGRPVVAKMYLNGPSEIRVESPAGVSQCAVTITVIRGTSQNVACDKKQIMVGCNWFRSKYDPSKPGSASAFDFSSLGESAFLCREWTYDTSKFSTPGESCQLG